MPSTYTTRNRLEKQAQGENSNTWGTRLNENTIDLIDFAADGMVSFALSTTKTLTDEDGAADEARARYINITGGTGGTVTIPNLEKVYVVRNATSGTVTFTTGSGTTATVTAGKSAIVVCEAGNVVRNLSAIVDAFSGNVSIGGTLAVTGAITATAGQIAFPAVQNASADANTLDDYEEGAVTPGVAFGGGTTGLTYGQQTGRYTKIGRLVVVTGFFRLTAKGSSTGSATITGLPITAGAHGNGTPTGSVTFINGASIAITVLRVSASATTAVLHTQGATGLTAMTEANFTDTTEVSFSVAYTV